VLATRCLRLNAIALAKLGLVLGRLARQARALVFPQRRGRERADRLAGEQ